MHFSNRFVLLSVGGAVFAIASGSASLASPSKTTTISYHGELLNDPARGTIDIRFREDSGRITASIHNAEIRCENNTASLANASNLQGRASRTGKFLIQRYYNGLGGQAYLEISGTIRHNRAKGQFYYLRNSLNPVAAPDCFTPAPEAWLAPRG